MSETETSNEELENKETSSTDHKRSRERQSSSEQNDDSPSTNAETSNTTNSASERSKSRKKRRSRKKEVTRAPREKPDKTTQQAIRILTAVLPHIPKNTRQLLEFFVRKECRVVLTRPPLLHYSIQQTILAAMECTRRLDTLDITYTIIRDLIENLLFLHKRHQKTDSITMASFAIFIRKLTTVLGELGSSLEKMSEVRVTDWQAIGDKVVNMSKTSDTQQAVSFIAYIPKMEEFEEIRFLGYGGFGYVYKVFYIPADITCSMKLVPIERFHQSKHACADKLVASVIKSPYLIRFFVCFAASEAYITVMEYVKGVDVLAVVNETSFLPIEQVQIITGQLICAVEHLHLRGFIHRDVKVSNIMIRTTGHIKLFDYDTNKVCIGHFAKRILRLYFSRTAHEFHDSEVAGSISYIAPEVTKLRPYGRSSDWWSVGVSIYKMCTGRVPFRGRTKDSLIKKISQQPLAWPKVTKYPHSATPEAKEYVYKLLKKNPNSRLGSRVYGDLKTDVFLVNLKIGLLWKYQRLIEITKIDGILEKAENQETIAPTEVQDEDTELTADVRSTKRIRKFIRFEQVSDEANIESHKELYTFASVRFKKLVDRLKATDYKKFKGCENALNPRTPPSPEIDYTKASDIGETLLQPTQQLTEAEKQAQLLEQIDIEIVRSSILGLLWSFGFTLQEVNGEGGLMYHMVNYIKPDSAASKSQLLIGDIVTTIDGVKIVGLPAQVVMANVIGANKGVSMTLTVFKSNPFRLVQTRRDISKILADASKTTLHLRRIVKPTKPNNAFGFATQEVKTWDETLKTFTRVHLLNSVDPARSGDMFVGDIIFEINAEPVDALPQTAVNLTISRVSDDLSVTLIPLSVLRRKELHETNLTDLNISEHQEGDIEANSNSAGVVQ